jgi:uncharacterized protein (DUF885 family)
MEPRKSYGSLKAIERCTAMPGQATAYLIGILKVMELQTQAQ